MAQPHFVFNKIYEISELNVFITLIFLFIATAVQFGFLGLVGKIIVESGERRSVYTERIIENKGY